MKVMFAAPEDAWGGILSHFRQALPGVTFDAVGLNPKDLSGFDVVIPTMSTLDGDVLATADRLQLIQQIGAGLEAVDIAAAESMGIAVANVPTDVSGNADSVAEMALMFTLYLMRRGESHPAQREQRRLGLPVGRSLQGATVGLVGFGAIGQAISRRLRGFGPRQMVVTRTPRPDLKIAFELDSLWGINQLPDLLAQADVVILAVPDTEQTHHLMNAETFARMKPGSYLINVGRGGLVEREGLQEALQSGQLAGAGLDVFWEEPPDPEDPIFDLNVITSPHVAGLTERSVEGIMREAANNIKALRLGKPLKYLRSRS